MWNFFFHRLARKTPMNFKWLRSFFRPKNAAKERVQWFELNYTYTFRSARNWMVGIWVSHIFSRCSSEVDNCEETHFFFGGSEWRPRSFAVVCCFPFFQSALNEPIKSLMTRERVFQLFKASKKKKRTCKGWGACVCRVNEPPPCRLNTKQISQYEENLTSISVFACCY